MKTFGDLEIGDEFGNLWGKFVKIDDDFAKVLFANCVANVGDEVKFERNDDAIVPYPKKPKPVTYIEGEKFLPNYKCKFCGKECNHKYCSKECKNAKWTIIPFFRFWILCTKFRNWLNK